MCSLEMQASIRVLVTGAAGQIAYSLLYPIAKGDVFGVDQVIILFMPSLSKFQTFIIGILYVCMK